MTFNNLRHIGSGDLDELAYSVLLALPLNERREAVALDLRQENPRFHVIPPHNLAEALGVPDPWQPGSDWSFICHVPVLSLETLVDSGVSASELVDLLDGAVPVARFLQLQGQFEPSDESDVSGFHVLSESERRHIEESFAKKTLEACAENGMNCIARCTVVSVTGAELEFEADIEDDGACVHLRTPYDRIASGFTDLSGCITSEW